jgi:hypothetical protein
MGSGDRRERWAVDELAGELATGDNAAPGRPYGEWGRVRVALREGHFRSRAHAGRVWLAGHHASHFESAARCARGRFRRFGPLDRDGRLLQAVPSKPGLRGQAMTGNYHHLAAATAGTAAVSNLVLSAARGVPVVGFARPVWDQIWPAGVQWRGQCLADALGRVPQPSVRDPRFSAVSR